MDGSESQELDNAQRERLLQEQSESEHKALLTQPENSKSELPIEQHSTSEQMPTGHNESTISTPQNESPNSASHETLKKSVGVFEKPVITPQWDSTNPQRGLKEELGEWTLEILSSFFFTIILVILAITLYIHREKPLPQWPFHVSINTLLSFYTLLFKSTLVFVLGSAISQSQWLWFAKERSLHDVVRYEQAAREPIGSFVWLLMDLRKLHRPLASLGAVLLIAAVLIDPFVQQLVQYVDCSVNITSSAATVSMPRTNFFNPEIIHIGADSNAPTSNEEAPLLSGLFAPPADVGFNCPTGNCTFSIQYSTVGWCSTCEDVSSTLIFNENSENTTTTLPNGFSLNSNAGPGMLTFLGVDFNYNNSTIDIVKPKATYMLTDPAAKFCGSTSKPTDWTCQGYGAASCTFASCVRTYNASVMAGRLTETLLSSTFFQPGPPVTVVANGNNYTTPSPADALVDTHCISPDESTSLKEAGYVLDPNTQWLPFNMTASFINITVNGSFPSDTPYPQSMAVHGCLYFMSSAFIEAFPSVFLSSVFNGTVVGYDAPETPLGTYDGPQVLQHMFNFGNMTLDWIESVLDDGATAMTNHIRENGVTGYSQYATGTATHFATCVHIQWGWIALPTVLNVLTIIFLALSIWATWSKRAPIWKDSLLAFIFHGPGADRWVRETATNSSGHYSWQNELNTLSEMGQQAKNITVRLDTSEPSIRLIQVDNQLPFSRPELSRYQRLIGGFRRKPH